MSFFAHTEHYQVQHPRRALLVGVFLNQSLEYILEQHKLLDFDIIQL